MTVNPSVHLNGNPLSLAGLIPQMMTIDDFFFSKKKKKKNQICFLGKIRKHISKCCMLIFFTQSAKHPFSADGILKYFLILPWKQDLAFHANCLQMSSFLEK